MNAMTVFLWILLGIPAMAAVTFLGGRLLGARRSLTALVLAGVVGWASAVAIAGAMTEWGWDELDMVLVAFALGTMFTMAVALGLDLIAPVGSLARGERAGLLTIRNPITAVRERVAPFRRYRQVVSIARQQGVLSLDITSEQLPVRVRGTLEAAGGIFVKLGQVASTRSDVLPPTWCDELSHLRTSAEPQPEAVVRERLTNELEADPDEVFPSFDWDPLASASIAQVYRATVPSGEQVVVKVQRTGLGKTLERDSAAIRQIANLIQRRTSLGLSVHPAELADEFLESVAEELDFDIESRNALELSEGLSTIDGIRVPKIYESLSTKRVLTEEFVSAPDIGDVAAIESAGLVPAEIADRLIEAFMHQIFDNGVFHADPHPGNILVEADGTIVLIDLGSVGRIGPGHRAAVLDMLAAASTGDSVSLRQALARITIFDRRLETRRLDAALESFLARYMRSGGGITAAAFEDLAALIGTFGIRLPRWFGTLTRTMVSLEGTLTTVDPDFSLVDSARRHAERTVGLPTPETVRTVIEEELMQQLPRLRRVPQRIDELMERTLSGQLSASVSFLSDERDARLLTRLVDRVVLAMIAAATGIGATLILRVDSGPELAGTITLNEVLGYFGIAAASVLALRVVAGVIRDGET
jgi:ubiquinone biosynthesis protein